MVLYTPERLAQICLHEDVGVYVEAIATHKHLSDEEKMENIALLDEARRIYLSKECVAILEHIGMMR